MPGPLPKPDEQRRRRNATPTGFKLPRSGRPGTAPDSPLPLGAASLALWADLWATPQAIAWEKLGLERLVARYARVVVVAEEDLTINLLTEARHLEDRLGLHPAALQRLRWEIVDDVPADRSGPPSKVSALDDYRALFTEGGE